MTVSWREQAVWAASLSVALVMGASVAAMADQIRLQDGKEFPATVRGKDAEHVVLAVPRASVAAIDGMADQVRLQNGTEFPAILLRKDEQQVLLALPRSSVATIDGQPMPPPVIAGSKAPAFTAVDLNGVTHALEGAGSRATLLQFWATWCPHCRSDLNLMKQLFTQYQGQGFRLLTVSEDQDLDKLRSFVTSQSVPYPVIPTAGPSASSQSALPDLYPTQGVLGYYLIDAKGVIAQVFSGSVTERPQDLEGAVKRLLAAAGPSDTPKP